MHLLQWNRETGPREAGPCTEDSIRLAKEARAAELKRDGLEQFVDDQGRVSVRLLVQTYQTGKFA
jgi:hypothetical protein